MTLINKVVKIRDMKNMFVLDKFESVVDVYPDKKAVADSKRCYTFLELKREALRVSKMIEEFLDEKREGVGVFVDRTIDTIVLMLGIIYSGNFYIPLDPSMPADRMGSILEDSEIKLIAGKKEQFESQDVELTDVICLIYENSRADSADNDEECIKTRVEGDTPLYMVYTSGSTGVPKGVLKSHSAMISFIEAYQETFDFKEDEVIGNQSPLYFDASAKDIYLMLCLGITLEILPTELFSMPTALIEYMNDRGVTFISWVPTALSIVVQLNTFSEVLPRNLKRVFFVGEVMPVKYIKKWKKYLPSVQYVNLYGASELAGICSYYEIGNFDDIDTIPLGKPLKNCEIFLLADDDSLVEEQEKQGEICIASEALATGYYKDTVRTEEKFQTVEINGTERRLYRSGDLGKYDVDGNLLYVGRSDFQIKHHGYRIELGEIESVVNRLSDVRQSACLYDRRKSRITLFCQLMEGLHVDERDVLNLLRGRIPDYMLPGKVVIMEAIPLNANGKVNYQGLKELL